MFNLFRNKTGFQSHKEATITEVIRQGFTWRVYCESTYWKAKSLIPAVLFPGDVVRVIDRHNITLIIEPISVSALLSQV